MKTQILQLEPHDDVISTRDKMGWGQAARIVLVWPKRERILVRKLDLLLLQRHALKMGAQLALVTEDPDVRYNARQLAIPVFKDQRHAHTPRWRAGRRLSRAIERRRPRPDFEEIRREVHSAEKAWYNFPAARRSLHAVSIFAALALLSLIIPAASIMITPETISQEMSIPVSASPNVKTVNLSGDLPAQVSSFVVEGFDQISTSGSMPVPEKSSFGRVEFTNLTDKAVKVPIGLVVSTLPENGQEPIRFSTTVSLDIPVGEAVLISVRSLVGGTAGNVPAREIKAIEGPLGLRLSVTNPAPTSGGSEQLVKAPNLQDARSLHDRLFASLQEAAEKQLAQWESGGDGFPVDASLTLVSVIEESYDPPMQDNAFTQPADRLGLKMQLEFQGLGVSNQDLQDMATRILDANLPEGYQPLHSTLELEHLTRPLVSEDSTAHWRISARRTLQAVVSEQEVREIVRGLSPAQASGILQSDLPLSEDAYIQLAPPWWPRLPVLPFRIQVSVR
jgi:hypothetical protein